MELSLGNRILRLFRVRHFCIFAQHMSYIELVFYGGPATFSTLIPFISLTCFHSRPTVEFTLGIHLFHFFKLFEVGGFLIQEQA